MDILVSQELWTILMISVTFSIFLMALVQKVKMLEFVRRMWQVWIINLFFAFVLGIPFGMEFFDLSLEQAVWVSVFAFIGAPGIYAVLKSQNIITYKPQSSNKDYVLVPLANEIPRGTVI